MTNNQFIKVIDDIAGYPIAVNISNILAISRRDNGKASIFLREPLREYCGVKKVRYIFCMENYNDVIEAIEK